MITLNMYNCVCVGNVESTNKTAQSLLGKKTQDVVLFFKKVDGSHERRD